MKYCIMSYSRTCTKKQKKELLTILIFLKIFQLFLQDFFSQEITFQSNLFKNKMASKFADFWKTGFKFKIVPLVLTVFFFNFKFSHTRSMVILLKIPSSES